MKPKYYIVNRACIETDSWLYRRLMAIKKSNVIKQVLIRRGVPHNIWSGKSLSELRKLNREK